MLFWLKKTISFWLMPLPMCLLLLVAGLLLVLIGRRPRLGKSLLSVGALLLLVFSNKYLSVQLVRPLEARYQPIPEFSAQSPLPPDLAACRYLVVLGGGNGNTPGLSATNRLSTSALPRLVEAVRILRHLPDARLIVCGPGDGKNPAHATVLADAAVSLGIARERILYIDQARDTEEEAAAAHKLAGDAPVGLVTSAWHLPRAMALFRHTGLRPVACPTDYSAHTDGEFHWPDLLFDLGSLERSTWAVRERLGYAWIALRGKG